MIVVVVECNNFLINIIVGNPETQEGLQTNRSPRLIWPPVVRVYGMPSAAEFLTNRGFS